MSAPNAAALWFDEFELAPLGAGHIHDTYLMSAGDADWVLQRVNQAVFNDPELVMAQTQRLLARWQSQDRYTVPELAANKQNELGAWLDGEYWRVWKFVDNTMVVDPLRSPAQARAAGHAFAALQSSLADLPGEPFDDTIEGFLQLNYYLQAYDDVAGAAPAALQRLVERHRDLAGLLAARNAHIHGDCKINNLLFDASGARVVAVIDFDTAMYGHWAWDFGDLVRSVSHSRGGLDLDYFGACLQGFAEHQPLANVPDAVAAPGYVALMLGVRFLTDHLQGDVYFRVAEHGENLRRAEAQFQLFETLVAQTAALERTARDVLES